MKSSDWMERRKRHEDETDKRTARSADETECRNAGIWRAAMENAVMNMKKKWWFVVFIPFLFAAFVMKAHGGIFTVSRDWDEEVQLHDGKIIEIERSVTRERCCGENNSYGDVISQKIIFHGEHGRIVWKDDIHPIIFDVIDSIYYVVADPWTGDECEKHGNPNPPFIFYKYDNNKWIQISHTEFPEGLQTNLLVNFWHGRTKDGEKILIGKKNALNGSMKTAADKFLAHFNKDLNQRCALL